VDGFNMAYRLDQGYRTRHHGERVMPSATWGLVAHTVELDGPPTPAKNRTGLVLDDGALRITAIEVDHSPIEPASAYPFHYRAPPAWRGPPRRGGPAPPPRWDTRGRWGAAAGAQKNPPPLARAAAGADLLVSEAIAPQMTRALGRAASSVGRANTAAVMHDIE